MSTSPPDPLTVFCPACNEAFLRNHHDQQCPQCHAPLPSADISQLQTMLWKTGPTITGGGEGCPNDRLEELIGQTLDKYQIESLLGRGGMGWVYLSRHLQLNRACAVKVLAPKLVKNDPEYLDRFCTEGQAAASLIHPNIVTIHAIGQADGLNYLEMEFVPGRTLQTVINTGPMMVWRATTIALGIANGLAAAHRNDIVHRDLKPDNVLLSHHGVPKISDFGLAKRLQGNVIREVPGVLAGTPHFMAPEIFAGQPATPASDIYALGVSYYYMLSGQLPLSGRTLSDLITAVTSQQAPSIRTLRPDLPLELCECLSLFMEKSPDNRPRDGIEAAQLLQAILGQTRDLESLMHEAFDDLPTAQWVREGDGFRVDVALTDGRQQRVFVVNSEHRFPERLLQIYSICCPAAEHYFATALRLNAEIAHGALAIRNIQGSEYFVIANAYPRATVDGEEIRQSVMEIAAHADAIELSLTGNDLN